MRRVETFLLYCITLCCMTQPCWAWSEGGHHLVAVMAYELLSEAEQQHLQELLRHHPRWVEDFPLPKNTDDPFEIDLCRIGQAGYWPDVARSQPIFNRPNWHWQLGASLVIGDVQPPKNPGPLPVDATLESTDLHIAQAVELCRKIRFDLTQPPAHHALAICWLTHLVGDAHQPCHAGSLYTATLFPEGDRGATSIPTKQANNLHILWDGLLGPTFDAGDVRRRAVSIKLDIPVWSRAAEAAHTPGGLNPLKWLAESTEYGRSHVYTTEVLSPIEAAERTSSKMEPIELSANYLKAAGELARVRAAYAAHRLASIYREAMSH